MKVVWTSGLNKEKATEMRREFVSSSLLRERLSKILSDKIETKRRIARSNDQYENAAWAYQQADSIGYERALNEIISLISSDPVTKQSI